MAICVLMLRLMLVEFLGGVWLLSSGDGVFDDKYLSTSFLSVSVCN